MILIFSVSYDPAANAVSQWIEKLGSQSVRINHDEPDLQDIEVSMTGDECSFVINGTRVCLSDFSAVWYRKGLFWVPTAPRKPCFPSEEAFTDYIGRKLTRENERAAEYFHFLVRSKGIKTLGNPFLGDPNKLVMMHRARGLGLDVPAFQITNRLPPALLDEADQYITKAISDGIYFWDAEGAKKGYFSYTENFRDLTQSLIGRVEIPLSFVQEKIDKKYEIRAFYLDGQFQSAAIISQNDEQTKLDYRKYNSKSPNRNIPVKLPLEVEIKLDRLFRSLELNTGSVDLIRTPDDRYVFLEINPVGMYGNLVSVCNFDIDRKIATWLCGD
jgi:ATP-GRASP peptide maturase of grasp-with-spasm system